MACEWPGKGYMWGGAYGKVWWFKMKLGEDKVMHGEGIFKLLRARAGPLKACKRIQVAFGDYEVSS